MVKQEYLFAYTITLCSFLSVGQVALSILRAVLLGESMTNAAVLLPVILSFITVGFHSTTLKRWQDTAVLRTGMGVPQVINSTSLCISTFILGLLWLIISIVIFVVASKPMPRHTFWSASIITSVGPWAPWTSALAANVISCLLWIEFGMAVFFHRRFHRHPPGGPPPEAQNKILAQPHTRWIVGLMIACMITSFIIFGISFGDGAYGGYSFWIIPLAVVFTEVVHSITFPVWNYTAKKRRGTPVPPFVYSIILILLVFLLASLWLAAGVISILILVHKVDNSKYISWSTYSGPGTILPYVRWVTASLSLVVSCLLWAQLWLIIHYRIRFFRRVKKAGNAYKSAVAQNTAPNPNNTTVSPDNYASNGAAVQPSQMVGYNNQGYSVYNPAYQMTYLHPVNPMFQNNMGR
ncbi:hypothetical protein FRC14_007482 [Serendipita sp. 396]|nr:hypothetical protein FRC14_007482 [Serendipita sp. 396]KAG8774554.1 hypothetical protein FRC15_001201 [Serendipita sp. 397]KAG8788603.1 hypothetical protein FRC16_001374 [Serendipita sp. 398]